MKIRLTAKNLTKTFNRRVIFEGVSCSLTAGETLVVSGRNGSGKSTLLKILAQVLTPTSGTVSIENSAAPSYMVMGFVSPYLNLYDEFTARENLEFALSVRGMPGDRRGVDDCLARVTLGRFKDTPSRVFSSGMKQRLKLAFALIHKPQILLLDEPMSNLDGEGKDIVKAIMEEHIRKGILVVATNERSEVIRHDSEVNLDHHG